ncbi:MAG: T9SS type A sorting domain-containing protein [Flavobacterium sp.]|uniref:DUF7619 domain-containing protein n=1 Tax=Flavobacterium sp. TaxID=239 RepID=UPI0022C7E604|nr:T9SS type A sorting domain-containing protein [Flavobacterium sp.]MCZ8197339.1 T9SS type A sorting domain-containing protein [Flavobacterium sp.]
MKNITFLLLILFSGIASSQTILFDGNSFKNKLLQSSVGNSIAKNSLDENIKIDANNDFQISQQEAILVYKLDVSQSSITNLVGLEYFTNLRELECDQNDFETIDVSTLIHLTLLKVENNNNLLSIYAKNGINEGLNIGGNTPNLVYICADEGEVESLIDEGPGSPNYIVDSYCSYAPGGSFNKISGKILFDAASNGIDATDIPQANIKLVCTFGSDKLQTVTNSLGEFILNTKETGVFNFEPVFEHSEWFSFTAPTSTTSFLNTNDNVFNYDFVVTPIGQHFDVEVVMLPIVLPAEGSLTLPTYEIMYRNKGNQTQSGQVTFSYNSSLFNSVSPELPSNTVVSNQSAGLLTLGYTDLKPFESRVVRVSLQPAVSFTNGQSLQFSTTINPDGEEPSTQIDNNFVLNQTISNTNDACWIKCMEGASLPSTDIGEYLNYVINIENEATANANYAVAKMVIDTAKFDINSLQILSSFLSNPSAPIEYNKALVQVQNNVAMFHLRSSMQGGEPGGSGGILFKIKTLDNLPVGSTVSNNTKISFDYDYTVDTIPLIVTTNTANTTFQTLSVSINTIDKSISIYPNPANSIVTVASDGVIQLIQLYDVYGRLLETNITSAEKASVDVSQRAAGTYFLKITSDKGQKVEKIIKK